MIDTPTAVIGRGERMTERERKILEAIGRGRNGIASADDIAHRLGYPRNKGRLAVSSTLRAMQRKGLIGRIPPEDQWDHADWFAIRETP